MWPRKLRETLVEEFYHLERCLLCVVVVLGIVCVCVCVVIGRWYVWFAVQSSQSCCEEEKEGFYDKSRERGIGRIEENSSSLRERFIHYYYEATKSTASYYTILFLLL